MADTSFVKLSDILFFFFTYRCILFIGAILIHAVKIAFSLFHKEHIAANGTFFIRGHIPNGKITFWIFGATEKDGPVLAEALDERCAAFRASNADLLTDGLGIFAFREIAASIKLTVTALADDDIAAAELAFEVCLFGLFLFGLHVTGSVEGLCVFTFGITGAGGKFAESA